MKLSLNVVGIKLLSALLLCFVCFGITLDYAVAKNAYSARSYSQPKTVVVYLMGLAGTGKYTIAKKISSQGYKLVDNHLINNPIFSLLGKDGARNASDAATDKIDQIRTIVLNFVKEDKHHSYVLTNQLLENPFHRRIYNEVMNTATQKGAIFVPVKLLISSDERARRIVQPDRGQRFKITSADEAYKERQRLQVSHRNLLVLDVTNLSAEEAANRILQHVHAISERRY